MKVNISLNDTARKVLTELMPSIKAIFELGFIPSEDEIVEFHEALYASYHRQTGSKERPMYTISPKDPKHQDLLKDVPVPVLTAQHIGPMKQGIAFFKKYAEENNLPINDSEAILSLGAKNFPPDFTQGTKYEQPASGANNESATTPKDQWMDILSKMGSDSIVTVKYKDEQNIEREQVIAPGIEKAFEGKKMSYQEFKRYAIDSLSKIFGKKYEVVESVSQKEDELSYEVIHVKEKRSDGTLHNGVRIGPYYTLYELGNPLGELILDAVKAIEESDVWLSKIDFKKMSHFDEIKEKIIVRPIRYASNKKTLDNYMYRREGDIALVIYMIMNIDDAGLSTAKIAKNIIKGWNLSEKYIFDWALQNTYRLFPPYIVSSESVMFSGVAPEDQPAQSKYFMNFNFVLNKSNLGAYHLFVNGSINHASAVFYPGVLKRLSQLLNDDLYLVISSVDFVVIHVKSAFPLARIKMLAQADKGRPYVDDKTFLTERVYYYSRAKDSLVMV